MTGWPTGCVLDASAMLQLFLPEQHSETVYKLIESHGNATPPAPIFVPDLLFAECGNVLRKRCLQGEIPSEEVVADVADLCALFLVNVPTGTLIQEAVVLALEHEITAYDACYVALSVRSGVPLVTADQRLARRLGGRYQTIALEQLAQLPDE